MGLMLPVAYGTFNFYFVKKRDFAMYLAQTLKGVLIMLHPIMVVNLMNTFGFRYSMAIIAAVNANNIVGMLVMHPVEWHLKTVKTPIYELQPRKLTKFHRELFG